jgi:hypothetical protein
LQVVIFAPKFYETYINRNKSPNPSDVLGMSAPMSASHSRENSVSRNKVPVSDAKSSSNNNNNNNNNNKVGVLLTLLLFSSLNFSPVLWRQSSGSTVDLASRDRRIKQLEEVISKLNAELAHYRDANSLASKAPVTEAGSPPALSSDAVAINFPDSANAPTSGREASPSIAPPPPPPN